MQRTKLLLTLILVIGMFAFTTSCKKTSEPDTPQPTKVANPVFSPAGGNFNQAMFVSIGCATVGAVVRYTLDGTEPTKTSFVYSEPISVTSSVSVKAKATKSGMSDSDMVSAIYTLDVVQTATPIFTPPAGEYHATQTVAVKCATPGATVYYSVDGSSPTLPYVTPLTVSTTTTLKARAVMDGLADSEIGSAAYTIFPPNLVATPTFNPPGGSFTTTQSVTISCGTPGAVIRYTVNGSEPTDTSSQYSTPISVSATSVIKAKAYKTDWVTSDTAMAIFYIGSGYNFNNWDDYDAFIDTKDWYIIISWEMSDANSKYMCINFERTPEDVSHEDTFLLEINGANIPVYVNQWDDLVTETNMIPIPTNVTQLQILFKRDNTTVFTGIVTIPSYPQNLIIPNTINLTQPIPVSWSLAQNSHLQSFGFGVWVGSDLEQYDWYDAFLQPADRSHTIPANSINIENPTDGVIYVNEGNLAEYGNTVVVIETDLSQDAFGNSNKATSPKHSPFRIRNK